MGWCEAHRLHLLGENAEELNRIMLRQAERAAPLVDGEPEEVGVGDARDLDGVLEGEEDALLRTVLWLEVEQVLSLAILHGAARHLVGRVAHEHLGKGALARAVGPHDRVHLAALHLEVDALEDTVVLH